ncbi:MAG TPA: GIY-YIG nuclease family protein [Candidatus Saccharimonadales bacterium]|nr:GIY-YIG nuclease family protein [Candidatus Saccharimonadales bacterium]
MFYTYILQSLNFPDQIYIGFTQDINHRLLEHNSGTSFHTSKFKPWKIIFFSAFETANQAILFEKYLKSCSGRTFIKKHC